MSRHHRKTRLKIWCCTLTVLLCMGPATSGTLVPRVLEHFTDILERIETWSLNVEVYFVRHSRTSADIVIATNTGKMAKELKPFIGNVFVLLHVCITASWSL